MAACSSRALAAADWNVAVQNDELQAVMRAVTVIRIGLFLAFSHSVPGWAATILDVEKIVATGRNVIRLSTGMLERVAPDSGMAAALVGKAYAHLYVKHSLRMVSNLPHLVYGAVAIGNNAGNRHAAADAASTAFGLMGASFIREQEVYAKKVFPDPISGIGGDATVLKVPTSS